jgi:hypothetical protein
MGDILIDDFIGEFIGELLVDNKLLLFKFAILNFQFDTIECVVKIDIIDENFGTIGNSFKLELDTIGTAIIGIDKL